MYSSWDVMTHPYPNSNDGLTIIHVLTPWFPFSILFLISFGCMNALIDETYFFILANSRNISILKFIRCDNIFPYGIYFII